MKLCKKCKKEISSERLEIIPDATECGLCLNKLEYKHEISDIIQPPIPKANQGKGFIYSFVPVTFNGKKVPNTSIILSEWCTTLGVFTTDSIVTGAFCIVVYFPITTF